MTDPTSNRISEDYIERVYAGVLGKIIGVYLGRPIEQWWHNDIVQKFGEVWYYVHEQLRMPLIVTDDDISGTFTFLRALTDNAYDPALTPAQIGQTWLNYIVENKTILWWGGMGLSTEHTAFLRMKEGAPAPRSGSIATNGQVVAEQIGAQIFIDGWGLICPGDPGRAADFARRAASVSHDGEAIYGAQVVAALVAAAFVETNIGKLLDSATQLIPHDCLIRRLIDDLRSWHAETPDDWRGTFRKIEANYGYDKYGGNCHIIPNHALIIHALLHGEGDFGRSLMIVNTCGWDTDCNAANVGCILGVRGGLLGIGRGADFRTPVADRLFLPTADGGRCITDAVQEAYAVARTGYALSSLPFPPPPKQNARFHFSLPGSVQGWLELDVIDSRGTLETVGNTGGKLALHYRSVAPGRVARAATDTFITTETASMSGYELLASPTLYSGQVVRARVIVPHGAGYGGAKCRLFLQVFDEADALGFVYGKDHEIVLGADFEIVWTVPDTNGYPIARIGIEIMSAGDARADGVLHLDYLTWEGIPKANLGSTQKGKMWRRAWVLAADHFVEWGEPFRIIQDRGTGLLIQGCREWRDYRFEATIKPHMASAAGVAVRVQGLGRYYALQLCHPGRVCIVRVRDGETLMLNEKPFDWRFGEKYHLAIEVVGDRINGYVEGKPILSIQDDSSEKLYEGAVGILLNTGRMNLENITISCVDKGKQ